MKKKTMKTLLKKQQQKFENYHVTFTDGTNVTVRVDVSGGDMRAKTAFLNQLRTKSGSITAANGHTYLMRDMVHYELAD